MRSFVVIDAPQRSPEWFAARLGRATGSVASDMLARTKTGWSASRRNLLLRLVLERLTGQSQDGGFVSAAMQAGIDREPLAFAAYESMTGQIVERSGFLSHTSLMAGCSLDGHIGDFETLLSIKCRQPAAHLEFLKSGTIPGDALIQMRHELWMTGASAHEYLSFNPDFPEALQCRITTLMRADAEIPAYEDAVRSFLDEVHREYEALATLADLTAVLRHTKEG